MSALSEADRELLAPLARHEQAARLLAGLAGPLVMIPFPADVAALAYIVYLAYRRARAPGNMLSGRPGYEAAETLLHRVVSTAQCCGSFTEFGHQLHERLHLSLAQLQASDQLWWLEARQVHGSRWRFLATDLVLTEACTAARLLDEWFYELAQKAEATEAVDAQ